MFCRTLFSLLVIIVSLFLYFPCSRYTFTAFDYHFLVSSTFSPANLKSFNHMKPHLSINQLTTKKQTNKYFIIPRHYTVYRGSKYQANTYKPTTVVRHLQHKYSPFMLYYILTIYAILFTHHLCYIIYSPFNIA
jgi:hypothetical protein